MSQFKHRDEDIEFEEAPEFKNDDYTVTGDGIIYKASTRFGNNFSDRPDKALDDAKEMIDKNLDKK